VPDGIRVHVLDGGRVNVTGTDAAELADDGAYEGLTLDLPVPCFLIRHPDGDLMWDTGMSRTRTDLGGWAAPGPKIDEQLQDLENTVQTNRLSLQLAESELRLFKTRLPMDLASASRTRRIAEEDLNYFLKIGRAYDEESAKFSLKSYRQSLEYAEEELKQLEEMYEADDLTEETEEIILKRARNDVERSKFYLKLSELRTERTLTQDIPREEQQLTEAARRAEIALTKTKETLPVELEKQQIERDKQLLANRRAEEKLNELRKDRQMMDIKSPSDGSSTTGAANVGSGRESNRHRVSWNREASFRLKRFS